MILEALQLPFVNYVKKNSVKRIQSLLKFSTFLINPVKGKELN